MPTAHLPIHFKKSKNACLSRLAGFALDYYYFFLNMFLFPEFDVKVICNPPKTLLASKRQNFQAFMNFCRRTKSPLLNRFSYITGLTLASDS